MSYPEITKELINSKGKGIDSWNLLVLRREIPMSQEVASYINWHEVARDLLSDEDFIRYRNHRPLTRSSLETGELFFSLYYGKDTLVDKMVKQVYGS
jgi:hypothetical protein